MKEQNKLLKALKRKYPAIFGKTPTPLKVGIHLDILGANKDIDPIELKEAMHEHCRSRKYLLAVAREGAERKGIDGGTTAAVTSVERKYAKILLKRHKPKSKNAAPAPDKILVKQSVTGGAVTTVTVARRSSPAERKGGNDETVRVY